MAVRQITISFCKRAGMGLFTLFFVLNTTAWAGKIFNWKNETGHTNFTDYRSSIPLKNRGQIKDEVKPPPKLIFPESTLTEAALDPEAPLSEEGSQESEKREGRDSGRKGNQRTLLFGRVTGRPALDTLPRVP